LTAAAFKFHFDPNLRPSALVILSSAAPKPKILSLLMAIVSKAGPCRLKAVQPRFESTWCQRLTLNYNNPISEFAVKFKLQRYTQALPRMDNRRPEFYYPVRRCRLTVSKPVFKAPMVSALETTRSQTAFNVCLRRYYPDDGIPELVDWKYQKVGMTRPGGLCSPRHTVAFNSRDEGSKCVSRCHLT
jgi:hypothetical protein